MRQQLRGIDHVVILVGDLDQAARAYAAMGFTLTPRGPVLVRVLRADA